MSEILDSIRSIPDSPQGLLEFVTNLFLSYGYLVIFLCFALDNFGLPASGDVVLFAGGFFANSGQMSLPLVMLAGASGGWVSDNIYYWIGRKGGRPLLNRITKTRILRHLISEKSLGRVESYYVSHGGKTVFVGRFGPGLRSMTPLFAGVTHMNYWRFLPYNLADVAVWSIAYTMVGYVFGQYWSELLSTARSFGYVLVALVALLVAFLIFRRGRAMKKADREED
jgi:membrane protein DedA with SNARE-associated domain